MACLCSPPLCCSSFEGAACCWVCKFIEPENNCVVGLTPAITGLAFARAFRFVCISHESCHCHALQIALECGQLPLFFRWALHEAITLRRGFPQQVSHAPLNKTSVKLKQNCLIASSFMAAAVLAFRAAACDSPSPCILLTLLGGNAGDGRRARTQFLNHLARQHVAEPLAVGGLVERLEAFR